MSIAPMILIRPSGMAPQRLTFCCSVKLDTRQLQNAFIENHCTIPRIPKTRACWLENLTVMRVHIGWLEGKSLPNANGHKPAATIAALPDDEPPQRWEILCGFLGVPFLKFAPDIPRPSSCRRVLPIRIAPACLRAWIHGASSRAGLSIPNCSK